MSRDVDTGTDQLVCTVADHVATVSFNRPNKRNALGDIVTPALRQILLLLEADPDVRVIVLTGVGKAFCAGGDVKGMGGGAPDDRSIEYKVRILQHRQQTLTLHLHELPKPTIAALPGAAAGAGMSIALACDIRIGATSALYATGFAAIGLSGSYGASWQLTQIVGPAKAEEIYFTGRRILAQGALALGLLNEVVADEDLQTRTAELAQQNINRAIQADFKTCLDWEADRLRADPGPQGGGARLHREAQAAFSQGMTTMARGRHPSGQHKPGGACGPLMRQPADFGDHVAVVTREMWFHP